MAEVAGKVPGAVSGLVKRVISVLGLCGTTGNMMTDLGARASSDVKALGSCLSTLQLRKSGAQGHGWKGNCCNPLKCRHGEYPTAGVVGTATLWREMSHMSQVSFEKFKREPGTDFRARATFGVAITAIVVVFPVGLMDLYIGHVATGIGALGIVFILAANAWMVSQGLCHQNLTLFGMIPASMVFMIHVFQSDALIGSLWCYPALLACYCMLSEHKAWWGNAVILVFATPMVWMMLDTPYAIRITATLLAVSAFAAIMVRVIDEQRRLLQEQLVRDPLTGLLNRLTYNLRMEKSVAAHSHHHHPVSLLAIDIDLFKRLNDTQGHAAGDRVLQRVARILLESLRQDDAIFRMGGEEFTVLLESTSREDAVRTAQQIRQTVALARFEHAEPVTVSIGVAILRHGEDWERWAKRCDDRLYAAKRLGRNRVVASDRARAADCLLASLP